MTPCFKYHILRLATYDFVLEFIPQRACKVRSHGGFRKQDGGSCIHNPLASRTHIQKTIDGNSTYNVNKVITTLVIRLLDDPHDVLNLWSPICDPSVWGMWGQGMGLFDSPPTLSY